MEKKLLMGVLSCICLLWACQSGSQTTLSVGEKQAEVRLAMAETMTSLSMVCHDTQGKYWFANGLDAVYSWEGDSLIHYPALGVYKEQRLLSVQEDEKGNLFFDTNGGVIRMEGTTIEQLEVADTVRAGAWTAQPQDLWFRMGWEHKGAFRYDGERLHFMEFPRHPLDTGPYSSQQSYNSYGLYSLYKDSSGGLWFGTASLGLFYFDGSQLYTLYDADLSITRGGGEFGIRSIIEGREGYLWVNRADIKIKLAEVQEKGDSVLKQLRYERLPGITDERISSAFFFNFAYDGQGHLWFSDNGMKLWHYDAKDLHLVEPEQKGEHPEYSGLRADREGKIWVNILTKGPCFWDGEKFDRFLN